MRLRRPLRLALAAVLLALPPARATCGLDGALLGEVNRAIEACLVQDWNRALERMDALVESDSSRPEPWFYRATIHAYRMTDEESFRQEALFFADLDSARARLDSPRLDDEQRRFLEGSILAWKAYQLGRRGQWWPALKLGLRGARELEALYEDCPDWADLELGIGNFRFWRSVKLSKLDWLPFVEDERESSLRLVAEARAHGQFSPWVAASNLTWMWLELGRPAECLAICDEALAAWPGSRLFRYPRAEALLRLERWEEAEAEWAALQAEAAGQVPRNIVNEFVCLEKRSGALEALGRTSAALELGRTALALPLDAEQADGVEERLDRLRKRVKRLEP